jgi:hypothetical protein
MPAVRTSWISLCPNPSISPSHSHTWATRSLCPALCGSLVSSAVTRARSVRSWARSSSPYCMKAQRATNSGASTRTALNQPTLAGIHSTTKRKPMTP